MKASAVAVKLQKLLAAFSDEDLCEDGLERHEVQDLTCMVSSFQISLFKEKEATLAPAPGKEGTLAPAPAKHAAPPAIVVGATCYQLRISRGRSCHSNEWTQEEEMSLLHAWAANPTGERSAIAETLLTTHTGFRWNRSRIVEKMGRRTFGHYKVE